jgi:hypothetical protein
MFFQVHATLGEERDRLAVLADNLNGKALAVRIPKGPDAGTRRRLSWLLSGKRKQAYRLTVGRYVDSWLDAGRLFGRWREQNAALARRMERLAAVLRVEPVEGAHGAFSLRVYGLADRSARQVERTAVWDFLLLLASPAAERFGKCDRCARYYVSRTARPNKRFCSRSCAWRDSATQAVQRKRQTEWEEKLKRTRAVLRDLLPEDVGRKDWKKRVARKASVTPNWLTRAINRGDLKVPYQVPQGGTRGRR